MANEYNEEQYISETEEHINNVAKFIDIFCAELVNRSFLHDHTKLEEPEKQHFLKYIPLLKGSTYGTEEYYEMLKGLKPALDHHYANTRHHPESFPEEGIEGMNLVDLVELFCDWMAAVKRHNDGNIQNSIKINTDRFGMSDQLVSIFKNTVTFFEENT